jgi:hypothetical protein
MITNYGDTKSPTSLGYKIELCQFLDSRQVVDVVLSPAL